MAQRPSPIPASATWPPDSSPIHSPPEAAQVEGDIGVDELQARLPGQGERAGKVGGDHRPHQGGELLAGHQRAGVAQPGPVPFGGGVVTRDSADLRAQPHVGAGAGERFGPGHRPRRRVPDRPARRIAAGQDQGAYVTVRGRPGRELHLGDADAAAVPDQLRGHRDRLHRRRAEHVHGQPGDPEAVVLVELPDLPSRQAGQQPGRAASCPTTDSGRGDGARRARPEARNTDPDRSCPSSSPAATVPCPRPGPLARDRRAGPG